jgi:uncharacterized glyoxalase superfamily protein PhnB
MNLNTVEIKAFVPARDYALSKRFYSAIGFHMASDDSGVAYFHAGDCSFLLQDFYDRALAENLMLHLLVESADDWHARLAAEDVAGRFGVRLGDLEDQPWGMRDFTLHDPSGVLWRIAHNIPRS